MSKDSANLLGWFGKRKEGVISTGLRTMMLSVQDSVRELGVVARCMAEDDIPGAEKAIERLFQFEHSADAEEDELCNQISIGELGPQERQDLMTFIRKTDHIANWAKEAAIDIRLINEVGITIPRNFWETIGRSVSDLESEVRALANAIELMGIPSADIMECIHGVREMEKELDRAYFESTKMIFTSDLDGKALIMATRIVDSIEQAADVCKASSDTVSILHYAKKV